MPFPSFFRKTKSTQNTPKNEMLTQNEMLTIQYDLSKQYVELSDEYNDDINMMIDADSFAVFKHSIVNLVFLLYPNIFKVHLNSTIGKGSLKLCIRNLQVLLNSPNIVQFQNTIYEEYLNVLQQQGGYKKYIKKTKKQTKKTRK
jgi:hypothetical protein